jgi:hypothetical protein
VTFLLRLLFQWASIKKNSTKQVSLVQRVYPRHLIKLKACFYSFDWILAKRWFSHDDKQLCEWLMLILNEQVFSYICISKREIMNTETWWINWMRSYKNMKKHTTSYRDLLLSFISSSSTALAETLKSLCTFFRIFFSNDKSQCSCMHSMSQVFSMFSRYFEFPLRLWIQRHDGSIEWGHTKIWRNIRHPTLWRYECFFT